MDEPPGVAAGVARPLVALCGEPAAQAALAGALRARAGASSLRLPEVELPPAIAARAKSSTREQAPAPATSAAHPLDGGVSGAADSATQQQQQQQQQVERQHSHGKKGCPDGILPAGWLDKHNARRPAAVCVLLSTASALAGGPAGYQAAQAAIDSVKASKRDGVRMALCAVRDEGDAEGTQLDPSAAEMLTNLRRRADVDVRLCFSLSLTDGGESAASAADVLAGAARTHYEEAARRTRGALARQASTSDRAVRYAIKTAHYAEYAGDLASATKYWAAAYSALEGQRSRGGAGSVGGSSGSGSSQKAQVVNAGPGGAIRPWSRWREEREVAAYINERLCALRLRLGGSSHEGQPTSGAAAGAGTNGASGGVGVEEAVAQFRRHVHTFREHPAVGEAEVPLALRSEQWGWLSAQFKAFGETLQELSPDGNDALAPGADRALCPATFFASAARYAVRRRKAVDELRAEGGARCGAIASAAASGNLSPPRFEGQPPRLVGRGVTLAEQVPTDVELVAHVGTEELATDRCMPAMELIARAREQHRRLNSARGECVLAAMAAQEAARAAGSNPSDVDASFEALIAAHRSGTGSRAGVGASKPAGVWPSLLADALGHCRKNSGGPTAAARECLELAAMPASAAVCAAAREAAMQRAAEALAGATVADPIVLDTAAMPELDGVITCFGGFAPMSPPPAPTAFKIGLALRAAATLPAPLSPASISAMLSDGREVALPTMVPLRPGEWAVLEAAVPLAPPGADTKLFAREALRVDAVLLRFGAGSGVLCTRVQLHGLASGARVSAGSAPGGAGTAVAAGVSLAAQRTRPPEFSFGLPAASASSELAAGSGVGMATGVGEHALSVTPSGIGLVGGRCSVRIAVSGAEAPPGATVRLSVAMDHGGAGTAGEVDAPAPRLEVRGVDSWRVVTANETLALSSGEALVVLAPSHAGLATLSATLLSPGGDDLAYAEAVVPCVEALAASVALVGMPDSVALGAKSPPSSVAIGQTANLLATLTVPHSEALLVRSLAVEAASGWEMLGHSAAQANGGDVLRPDEERTELLQVRAVSALSSTSVGTLVVRWERVGADAGEAAGGCACGVSRLSLPAVAAAQAPLALALRSPPWARAGEPFEVHVCVSNATPQMRECEVVVTDAAGVLFSGERKGTLAVLPRSHKTTTYTLVATATGEVELPVVAVSCKALNAEARHSRRLHVLPAELV